MRLYELAEQLKTSGRDLFRQATALGLEITNIVSVVGEDDERTLRESFKRPLEADIVAESRHVAEALAAKKAEAERLVVHEREADAKALENARQRALPFLRLTHDEISAPPVVPAGKTAPESAPASPSGSQPSPEPPVPAPVETPVEPPAEPSLAPAATRAIGGIAPLPVRQRTAPRPQLVVPKPQPKFPKTPLKPQQKVQPGKALHPADERADAHAPKGVSGGGLQGAGGVSRASVRLRETPEEALARRDEQREKAKFGREKRAKERANAQPVPPQPAGSQISIHTAIVVKDLAEKIGVRPNQVIMELMKMGILASINQTVDSDTATKIAVAHGFEVVVEKSRRNSEAKPVMRDPGADDEIPEDRPDQLLPRPPVVTFLGHVDHGKTTLMDYIRKAHVAAGEAGGITQAISAYTVDVQGRKITFLDTPGHAAFSAMRARGASLTDIAVIIIAADDGIMPQTREAIQQARDAHVTIMVAINKCDLPAANPMRVMQQLQAESLTPEEWGGTTVVCQVSGVTGEGVGNLLDMISLQADVLELSANPNRRANGSVIEAQMAPGSGPVVSVLVTGGTLNVGDVVLCGEFYGRVRALTDSTGRRLKSAGPSSAVSIMGLSGVPEPGAEFRVMKNEKRARELAEEEADRRKEEMLGGVTQARSADEIFKQMHDADKLTLNLIVRADVQGSVEAIVGAIADIKSSKVSCNVIQSGTGAIAVNDIERAGHGSALVIGFNVSPESGVNALARHDGVRIQTFRIIYELINFVKQEMLALLPVEHREAVRGHAVVKQVFDMGKEGVVAGSLVIDGFVTSKGQFRVTRRGKLVHTGGVESIRHFKEVVEEVKAAQECGIKLDGFREVEEGDVLECFVFEELPKTL